MVCERTETWFSRRSQGREEHAPVLTVLTEVFVHSRSELCGCHPQSDVHNRFLFLDFQSLRLLVLPLTFDLQNIQVRVGGSQSGINKTFKHQVLKEFPQRKVSVVYCLLLRTSDSDGSGHRLSLLQLPRTHRGSQVVSSTGSGLARLRS